MITLWLLITRVKGIQEENVLLVALKDGIENVLFQLQQTFFFFAYYKYIIK